jgi:Flp pilus assembly protein TadG
LAIKELRRLLAPPQREAQAGQALVELALMAIILMVLLGFTLDIGRAYYSYLALKDAAGEGAYYGSVHPGWIDSGDCADPTNVVYRVKNSAPSGGLVNWDSVAVNVDVPSTTAGSYITVTATSQFQLIAPFTSVFTGGSTVPLTAVSSARLLAPVEATCA